MIKIEAKISGFGSCAKKLRRLAQTELGMESYIAKATDRIKELAYEYAPVNTGAMREQITAEHSSDNGVHKGVVTAGGGLIYVEYGTGPRAMMASQNGLPKNPQDIPHTSKGKWYIPKSALSAQQIADMTDKYHFPTVIIDGIEFLVCRGQAPQPFMYPAAVYSEELIRSELPGYIKSAILKVAAKLT